MNLANLNINLDLLKNTNLYNIFPKRPIFNDILYISQNERSVISCERFHHRSRSAPPVHIGAAKECLTDGAEMLMFQPTGTSV